MFYKVVHFQRVKLFGEDQLTERVCVSYFKDRDFSVSMDNTNMVFTSYSNPPAEYIFYWNDIISFSSEDVDVVNLYGDF